MITITYAAKFGPGMTLAQQVAQMNAVVLNEGELDILFLTQASNATAWNPTSQRIERTIELTETATFLADIVGPGGDEDAKREGAVTGLFNNKIALQIAKPVEQTIVLSLPPRIPCATKTTRTTRKRTRATRTFSRSATTKTSPKTRPSPRPRRPCRPTPRRP